MKTMSKKQSGLSLVELMIAVALGIFITSGIISLFVSSKQTYRGQENLSRMQENARFAMNFLAQDIRMADYSGCTKSSLNEAVNHLDTTSTDYDAKVHSFDKGIDGINGAAGTNSALDSPDEITIRFATDSGITVQAPYGPLASSSIKVSTANGLEQEDIIIISDCSKADIFQISNNNPSTSGNIVHNTGNATSPGNVNASIIGCPGANAHCLSKIYQADASILKLSTLAYSIKTGKSGRLSLFRNSQELVEGIDNMQILYGEDTDNDFSANYYVPAGTSGLNMDQVVSVRVSLLLSSFEDNVTTQAQDYLYNSATATPTDRRYRQVFTSTIAIRNRLK